MVRRTLIIAFTMMLCSFAQAENHDGGKAKCDAGDFMACYKGGENMMIAGGNDIAFKLFVKSCEGGIGKGCHFAGRFYDTGTAVEEDPAKALEYFEKACVAGEAANSCYWAADMYRDGDTVEADRKMALKLYVLGCKTDGGKKCGLSGNKYIKGEEEFSKYYLEYSDTVKAMNARAKRHCRSILWPC